MQKELQLSAGNDRICDCPIIRSFAHRWAHRCCPFQKGRMSLRRHVAKIREFQRKILDEVRCTVLGSAIIKENTRDHRHGMSSVSRAFSSVPRVYQEVATNACLKHTSDRKMLVQFLTSACLKHSSNLDLSLCICQKRMTETLFRREHACALSHTRTFETLFKIGALLVHSPQAHV